MVDLICIDVDGTLVGQSGEVRPRVWTALARARAAGVRLALCSGRPAFGKTRAWAERLDADGWHVFQNGASVLHLATGTSRSVALPPGAPAWLVERARRTGRLLELYSDTDYTVERDDHRARRHAALLGVPFAPRDLLSLQGVPVRAQWLVPHDEVPAVLAEPHDGLTLLASTSPVMPETTFVNVTAAGVDKAVAVRAVAAAYDVPLARVMMVGDGQNDVTALRAVGVPVAMANADPAVLAAARHVVGAVEADGLVEAVALALEPAARA
ncbi:MAG TPA: Cof-type HAD-IIB family hydrolase [Gemmatimonadaceae bacterium]|nr:Cof-type HAD-IIB family hydrolase [Gemmatimonadaceae bacterium]